MGEGANLTLTLRSILNICDMFLVNYRWMAAEATAQLATKLAKIPLIRKKSCTFATQKPEIMEKERPPYVPEPAIRRLPWYLACVSRLRAQGVEYVSSTAISRQLNVDASQIAKDLSYLNIKGKTRIGYEVEQLERELDDFLGFTRCHKAVMIGVGSLGRALISDSGLSRYGLNIVAGFDPSPDIVGTEVAGVPVYDMSRLAELRPGLDAEIAVIAVPVEFAAEVTGQCVAAGIKALWNFTPFHIKTSPGITIQNTSLYANLALMYNRMNSR